MPAVGLPPAQVIVIFPAAGWPACAEAVVIWFHWFNPIEDAPAVKVVLFDANRAAVVPSPKDQPVQAPVMVVVTVPFTKRMIEPAGRSDGAPVTVVVAAKFSTTSCETAWKNSFEPFKVRASCTPKICRAAFESCGSQDMSGVMQVVPPQVNEFGLVPPV